MDTSPCIDSGIDFLVINNNNIILNLDSSEYSGNMPDMGYFEYFNDIIYGDINLDSIINVLDIVLIVSFIIDGEIPEQYSLEAADLNQDGIINILDIVALVNIIIDN